AYASGGDNFKPGMLLFQGVVAQNTVKLILLQDHDSFAGGGAGYNFIAFALKNQTVGDQHGCLIIHDQDPIFTIRTHGLAMGRSTRKTVPLPRWLLTESLPAWFWMIPLTIHNPKPVPFSPLVVTKGSKMSSIISGGIPVPLSAIRIRTQLLTF